MRHQAGMHLYALLEQLVVQIWKKSFTMKLKDHC